jgi:glycerol uptake facilitator-like aquaporin
MFAEMVLAAMVMLLILAILLWNDWRIWHMRDRLRRQGYSDWHIGWFVSFVYLAMTATLFLLFLRGPKGK